MLMFGLGFLACYLAVSVFACICDKTDQDMAWLMIQPLCLVAIPFVWLACWPIWFFKNLSGVKKERFEWCKKEWPDMKSHHICGPIYLMHDPNASKIFKHWFLVRVTE